MEYLQLLPTAWGGAARACAASRTNRQAVDMVRYSISVTTVRYGAVLYSAVKSYSTYGTQAYGTKTNPLRGTERYGTKRYETVQ